MADEANSGSEGEAKGSDKKGNKKKESSAVTHYHELVSTQEVAPAAQAQASVSPVFDLAGTLRDIKKKFGVESVSDFSGGYIKWPVFPFGIPSLDTMLGIGGIARGRVIEIFGGEHVGKTSLCMRLAAVAQYYGIPVIWMDYEYAFDVNYAQVFGMSFDKNLMVFMQPTTLEEGFAAIGIALSNGFPGLVIIDSIPAMQPAEVLEKGLDQEARIAIRANKLSQGVAGILRPIGATYASVVFINQLRTKIGAKINPYTPEFEKYVTPGGLAMKFFTSMRLHMQRVHTESWEKKNKYSEIRVASIKNKLARPYMECVLTLYPGVGFDIK